MYTNVEENYIKTIYHIACETNAPIKTNDLSGILKHKPSTVTETLDRLSKKRLIWYQKYKGVELSPIGQTLAITIIRRHRLWESFLYQKLGFTWDEVHDLAEKLEHIHSPLLIDRLDEFLGRPTQDPHGEPIPDRNGKMGYIPYHQLIDLPSPCQFMVGAVSCNDKDFLRHLDKLEIGIGKTYTLTTIESFDGNRVIESNGISKIISLEVAKKILVKQCP